MNIKRILALLGVILLVVMYGTALVCAVIGTPAAMLWFKAAIACTVFVPVMIYAYSMVYRLLKGKGVPRTPSQDSGNKDLKSDGDQDDAAKD